MTTNRLAKSEQPTKRSAEQLCEVGNRKLAGLEPTTVHHLDAPRTDVEWIVVDGRPTIRWKKTALGNLNVTRRQKHLMDRRGQPMSGSDTFAVNKELERLGASVRYEADGSRYCAETGVAKPRDAA
jgi:hypothetical protein